MIFISDKEVPKDIIKKIQNFKSTKLISLTKKTEIKLKNEIKSILQKIKAK